MGPGRMRSLNSNLNSKYTWLLLVYTHLILRQLVAEECLLLQLLHWLFFRRKVVLGPSYNLANSPDNLAEDGALIAGIQVRPLRL